MEKKITQEQIESFIEDIIKVYKKHNLSISHEDNQGAFLIDIFSYSNVHWLMQAYPVEDGDEDGTT